jgi:hypothetical protein
MRVNSKKSLRTIHTHRFDEVIGTAKV